MKRSNNTYKKFDQEYLTELVDKFDIVEFINEYIPLSQAGQNYKTRCPFHIEKTASFVVSSSRGMYHCYGCKKGGNIIKFLIEREGMTFYEAVIFLSEKAGLTPPHTVNTAEYEEFKKTQEALLEANSIATTLWVDNLTKSIAATEYLKDRGITQSTIDLFKLGYALDGWVQVRNTLNTKLDVKILKSSGLISESESKLYDRFRNRVITPISDLQGKIVGFSGRTLSTDIKEAKYVNSPDTPIYNKGKHLFGLNVTKDSIRQKGFAILTEGNFDIISLYQNGVENAVAGLGTALTTDQAKLLKRFTDKVVICYDGDSAGETSTERAIKVLQAENFIIKVMELPSGSDPDEFIRKEGKNKFDTLRGQSVNWFRYLVTKSMKKHDLTNPTDKVRLLKRVQELVGFCTTELEKREYFRQAIEALKIEKDLAKKYWNEISSDTSTVEEVKDGATLTERKFLQLLIHSDKRKEIVDGIKTYLHNPQIRKIALILATIKGDFRYTLVESLLDENDSSFLRQLSLDSEYVLQLEDLDNEVKHCSTSIRRDSLQLQLKEVSDLISEGLKTQTGEWETNVNELFSRQLKIAKEITVLGHTPL